MGLWLNKRVLQTPNRTTETLYSISAGKWAVRKGGERKGAKEERVNRSFPIYHPQSKHINNKKKPLSDHGRRVLEGCNGIPAAFQTLLQI